MDCIRQYSCTGYYYRTQHRVQHPHYCCATLRPTPPRSAAARPIAQTVPARDRIGRLDFQKQQTDVEGKPAEHQAQREREKPEAVVEFHHHARENECHCV